MLAPGTRLGPYEIVAPAGAGGMGEVYRARDTRLDRTVAIKVLAANLSARPDVLQRFEREARAVSTLNHPNICTLHDIGTQDGTPYLVMEYLEGQTLAERLGRGPVPLAEAYRLAIQIGEALDQAHRKGIVHRDLKPGNVMLTGAKGSETVKLLDFGLAKLPESAAAATSAGASQTSLSTVVQSLTTEGTIVGTFQYMAPEQLEGKDADQRSDIFAFGDVLFEMVTGRTAFQGLSQASLISAIMKEDPPVVSTLLPSAPPALDRMIRRCLAKDPEDRWQSVRDLVQELRWVSESSSPMGAVYVSRPTWRFGIAPLLAGLFAVAFAVVASIHFREKKDGARPVRFLVFPPDQTQLGVSDVPVLSPDASRMVFSLTLANGVQQLALRTMDDPTIKLLPDTSAAYTPFWSPDSNQVGYFTRGAIRKVDIAGGASVTVCTSPGPGYGGTWSRDGVILQGGPTGITRVSAGGGAPVNVTKADGSRGETAHRWPFFLPDGRHFLFTVNAVRADVRGIYVGDLGGSRPVRLLKEVTNAAYSPQGLLLFTRSDVLTAQPFDTASLRLTGNSFPLVEHIKRFDLVFLSFFSTAAGSLAYANGAGVLTQEMTWFNRHGERISTVGSVADYSNPALSPDERSLAVGIRDETTRTRDIWIFDLARGNKMRLTFDAADDLDPLWSPDGRQIIFSSDRRGFRDLYRKAANGTGPEELLLESKEDKNAEDWSRDGKHLIYNTGTGLHEVWSIDPAQIPVKPVGVLTGPFGQSQARISPDGHWLAYNSTESGNSEIYVQNFPPAGGKWQISTSGGLEPQWRADGKELFYVQGESIMSVAITAGEGRFEAAIPKRLFDAPLSNNVRNRVVISQNGQKFLVMARADQATRGPFTVVLNWAAGRKR